MNPPYFIVGVILSGQSKPKDLSGWYIESWADSSTEHGIAMLRSE